jgi:DNA repair exonuclease SbcCD ATPase subunit
MSALSFKINAETDKLKSFITMLERLRQVLAEIPDSTKEFDVINRKIGEMEARVEQTMRKIAQMEQQAMDAASKATASATTGTAGGSSTPGTAATQAETAAYHELIEELRAVNASKRENVALISQYEAQIKRLKSKIIDLNKTESSGIKLTQDQKASRLNASVSIEEYKQALSRARQELANQIKLEQVARGSIDEVSQALGRMRTIYRSLNESERGSNWGQNLLKNIEGLDAKVKELDASMGVHTRNVGNYASGFNMLGFQIQQVARELPSLAYGPQIFFSAISNNLPMLADEIARAKKSVDELKKAGQTFTPVWKQIASSIFSWQTLLVAGVTVLTLYGKEITNWVASLFKGKTTIDASAAALERFNSAMAQGSVSAQSELTKLNLLYRAATDLSRPYEERAEAVKKLQDIYPAYFGNMAAEQVMVGNAVGAYENLRDAIIEVAKAKAAEKIITENQENINLLEATGNAYIDYVSAYKDYEDAWNNQQKLLKKYKTGEISKEQLGAGLRYFNAAKESVWEATDNLKTELQKLSGGKDLWDKIEKEYDSNVREYVNSVDKTNAQLVPVAEKLFVGKTPAELNAEWKKARQEAKSAAEKAASDQERNLKELDKQLQKLRDDALQAEVDSMKEGTARKLAQIDLDYQKRARAIQEAEERIRELQGGELTKGQQAQIKALNDANNAQRTEERASVSSISISPEGLASTINKNIQSWNEYLKEYGTFREKLQATKDIYDRKIENAGSIGERKALEAERDAAVAEIEVQAGQWVRELTGKTKDELSALKAELEASMQTLESEYNALDSSDSAQGQKLRGEINQTQAKINAVDKAASSTKLAPKDNAIKKWQRLERTLGDIADGFEGIGDAVGGTTGEVISAAGEIATNAASMISSIVTLTESSAAAITTTSTTAASAIKAVERASVILAIIQAVLTIATKIASLFNNDDEKQAEIDRLQGRIEQLQWELDNANAIRLQENSFNAIQKVKDAYNDATKAILSAYGKLSPFGEAIVKRINAAKIEEKAIKSIADAYSNLKYTDSNLLGENKFSDTRDKLNNLAEQQLLLQKQINAENDKKKPDKSKIKEWERQIQELGEEAAEVINEVVETIIGGTAEDIAKELGDAFIEAFLEGEDAAKAWGEKVDEIVADIVKRMLITSLLEEPIGAMLDELKSEWFKDGEFQGIEAVINSLPGFAEGLNGLVTKLKEGIDILPDEIKDLMGLTGVSSQQATSRGFQAMSQDTGDELNGRFTDIQGKVTDIRGYVMAQTQSIIGLLTSMANIETAMYASVQVNNELLRYAVMTYMEIVEINGNTAAMRVALQGIQEDIAAIKRNTSEL